MIKNIFIALALTLSACADDPHKFPTNPIFGVGEAHITTELGQVVSYEVEVAANDLAIARGLMHRRSILPEQGMIFLFSSPRPVSFWMRNTKIPLDMVFIAETGEIIKIHERALPMDETLIPSGGPVIAVLEINGGQAAMDGLRVGDMVTWEITQAPPTNDDIDSLKP